MSFSTAEDCVKLGLHSIDEKIYIAYLRQSIFYNWAKIVGENVAKKIKPLRIRFKTLSVYGVDASYNNQLYFYKSIFIKNINDFAGQELINDIKFGSPNERPTEDDEIYQPPPDKKTHDLKNVRLTDAEIREIEEDCKQVQDEDLRNTIIKTSINRAKLEKYHRQKDWHECKKCAALCPPAQTFCYSCEMHERAELRRQIRKIFRDAPWITYAEVFNEIKRTMPDMLRECIPETVESERTSLIQEIAGSLDHKNEMEVKLLTMLYKRIPVEQLNDKVISKALYALRYNLPMKSRMDLFNTKF